MGRCYHGALLTYCAGREAVTDHRMLGGRRVAALKPVGSLLSDRTATLRGATASSVVLLMERSPMSRDQRHRDRRDGPQLFRVPLLRTAGRRSRRGFGGAPKPEEISRPHVPPEPPLAPGALAAPPRRAPWG